MEKLIELYYEHKLDLLKRDMRGNGATEREIELVDIEKVEEDELEKNLNKLSELKPFINWLVDNNKIDRDKILKENGLFRKYFYDLEYVKNYDRLVMWLSVEDEPIEFLISVLK